MILCKVYAEVKCKEFWNYKLHFLKQHMCMCYVSNFTFPPPQNEPLKSTPRLEFRLYFMYLGFTIYLFTLGML